MVVQARPSFPGALDEANIREGARVTLHRVNLHLSTRLVITSNPFVANGKLCVCVTEIDGSVKHAVRMYLSDMGVIPYDNGCWNEYNYTTLTE